ncbi:helix-turn-helix domain-containing protein [Paenibacillus urinalis]|uniref:Helix-turn-helix domain-containing protein n=1 Tax=Paenibacillus urinalis TaxID=521520 RepID=A0AAX3MT91_9BACL|nr:MULTISPECIES: helix-turn-helix domain-containing protein [Paenibacillus]WDH80636.1 helix-turn-helix domain-containing protein [Paenibacillus urinalis]WDH96688.1 helix-turn-helix domain-containing protein [Paenibacillus urinalis]WDI00332.1 helix-turn-helix domain-containing protein [Paenibacillus urinalis]GAK40844.1 hypothetical protein TCA2_3334 [Paenibacillus sp. TCA20]
MRITFEMLVYQLSKKWNIHYEAAEHSLEGLHPPLLYESSLAVQKNHIYVMSDNRNSSYAGCCLVYCGIPIADLDLNKDSGIIVVDPEVPVAAVLNQIQSIFALYQDWENRMQQVVYHHQTLQELLDISSVVLDNLLCVTDENNHELAASYQGQRVESSSLGTYSKETNFHTLMHAVETVDNNHYKLDLKKIQETKESFQVYFSYINDGPINLGTLSVHPYEHIILIHDLQLLDILSFYVKALLLRPSQVSGSFFTNLLEALITGVTVSEADLFKLKNALHFRANDQFKCIVIQFTEDVTTKYGHYLKHRFQVENPSSIAQLYDDHLVGLINETRMGWDNHKFHQSISAWLGKIEFVAGASDSFTDLSQLNIYYQEALSILEYADVKDSEVRVFSDCWNRYVLSKCTGRLPASKLFPAGFVKVIQYNETSAVDYLETLRIWLEEGRNDSRTAARLYISRNTFLSRRDKLISLLESDLTSPDERFQLELCIRLYDMNQHDTINPSIR